MAPAAPQKNDHWADEKRMAERSYEGSRASMKHFIICGVICCIIIVIVIIAATAGTAAAVASAAAKCGREDYRCMVLKNGG